MAQNVVDFSIDPSGEQLLDTLLTGLQNNMLSSNSGSSRPSYAQNGTVWVDQTTTPWVWNMFNGTDDIELGTIDPTSLHFTPSNIPEILNNYSAVAAPTVNDDSGDGYAQGSKWFYDGDIWLCVDASSGAAVWVDTGLQLTDLGSLAVLDEVAFANIATGAIASQVEAEAGTASNKLMTPERVAQAIEELGGDSFGSQLFHASYETSGSNGGGTATGGSWQTRPLNTVDTNEITSASLGSNVISLPAGDYYAEIDQPFYDVNENGLRLRDTTNSITLVHGSRNYAAGGANVSDHQQGAGRFTLAGTTNVELQYYTQSTVSGDGLGWGGADYSEAFKYGNVKIWKVG